MASISSRPQCVDQIKDRNWYSVTLIIPVCTEMSQNCHCLKTLRPLLTLHFPQSCAKPALCIFPYKHSASEELAHCDFVKPYGDIDLGRHQLRLVSDSTNHILNQYRLIINEACWHSAEGNLTETILNITLCIVENFAESPGASEMILSCHFSSHPSGKGEGIFECMYCGDFTWRTYWIPRRSTPSPRELHGSSVLPVHGRHLQPPGRTEQGTLKKLRYCIDLLKQKAIRLRC